MAMEFRKECRVEVWCKKQVAWRLAEVLSSDGNHLLIRYEDCPCSGDIAAPRRVLKQTVRPLQPAVSFTGSVKVGDVVEVLDLCSWNVAIVLRVISGWFYLVRLLGSCEEVNVSRANIRVHQGWEKCVWRTLVKVHGPHIFGAWKNQNSLRRYENLSCDTISCESRTSIKMKNDVRTCFQDGMAEGSRLVPQRRLKRLSPDSLSSLEANSCYFHKKQATGTQSELLKFETRQLFRPLERDFWEKVDIVSYAKDIIVERNTHAFHSNQLGSCPETERKNSLGCHSGASNDDTDASSVGSCSIVDACTDMCSAEIVKQPRLRDHVLCSDAESCPVPEDEEGEENFPFSSKRGVAKEIHHVELHAYYRTLQALHASGPFSWEQEALLTNLRLSLNISNDEHLIGVKSLISSGTGSSFG